MKATKWVFFTKKKMFYNPSINNKKYWKKVKVVQIHLVVEWERSSLLHKSWFQVTLHIVMSTVIVLADLVKDCHNLLWNNLCSKRWHADTRDQSDVTDSVSTFLTLGRQTVTFKCTRLLCVTVLHTSVSWIWSLDIAKPKVRLQSIWDDICPMKLYTYPSKQLTDDRHLEHPIN